MSKKRTSPSVMPMRGGKKPITRRLLEGEHLFFAVEHRNQIGLYSHIRNHGKYLHIAPMKHGGQEGFEVWADDDPHALTERSPLPDPISL